MTGLPLSNVMADPVNEGVLPLTFNLLNNELAGVEAVPNMVPFADRLSKTGPVTTELSVSTN